MTKAISNHGISLLEFLLCAVIVGTVAAKIVSRSSLFLPSERRLERERVQSLLIKGVVLSRQLRQKITVDQDQGTLFLQGKKVLSQVRLSHNTTVRIRSAQKNTLKYYGDSCTPARVILVQSGKATTFTLTVRCLIREWRKGDFL